MGNLLAKEACRCNSRPSFDHVEDDEKHFAALIRQLFKTDWNGTGNHMGIRTICVVIKKTKNFLL